MEFREKQRLIRRIVSGKFYGEFDFRGNPYPVLISDPTLDLLAESDWIYSKSLKTLKENSSGMTLEDSYKILTDRGDWSLKLDDEYENNEKKIKEFSQELQRVKFVKAQQRTLKFNIEKLKKRNSDLYVQKNQLKFHTIEYLAEKTERRFIIERTAKIDAPSDLSKSPYFLDSLAVYYFQESGIKDSDMRELARNDPWRLYWATAKDTGTPLFRNSICEITDLQYLLLLWSRVYDFAFESQNRPPSEIINDDTEFDAWYEAEANRIDEENRKNYNDPNLGTGGTEMYLPADEEGAKEVYALNNQTNRSIIRNRQKEIENKGVLKEAELPDIKLTHNIERNNVRRP